MVNCIHFENNIVSVTASCENTVNAVGQTIKSPNYPHQYNNNENCNWLILGPPGRRLELKMNAFEVEKWNKSINAQPDDLRMYNGMDSSSDYMGPTIANNEEKGFLLLPASYIAYNDINAMYLQFHSDGRNTYSGFEARFVRHGKKDESLFLQLFLVPVNYQID